MDKLLGQFEVGSLLANFEEINVPLARISVSCGFTGFPSPATDYGEKELNVSEYLGIKKNKTWIFKASGQSMKDLGILDGDMLVVDTSLDPELDDLCICEVEGEYMAKMVCKLSDGLYLVSANEENKPIKLDIDGTLMVFGVVTGRMGKVSRKIRVKKY